MKDLIALMRQECERLTECARPYLEQAEKIQKAIDSLEAGHQPSHRNHRKGTAARIPRGKRVKALTAAAVEVLKAGGRTTAELRREFIRMGLLKRNGKQFTCYISGCKLIQYDRRAKVWVLKRDEREAA